METMAQSKNTSKWSKYNMGVTSNIYIIGKSTYAIISKNA